MRHLIALLLIAGVTAACSSSNPDVETGPDPQARTVPGTDEPGTEPEMKNENVPDHASTAARFGIPPGHLPPAGQCRVWMPGEPPGKQKKRYPSGDCAVVGDDVPAGGWLVYRPSENKKEVVVREYGRGSDVVRTTVWDIATGALLREIDPEADG